MNRWCTTGSDRLSREARSTKNRLRLTGFVLSDREVWARPVGVAVARNGSLLVSEDGNGTIWRVTRQSTAGR
jgi:glucose/arabinose dehydrogenase